MIKTFATTNIVISLDETNIIKFTKKNN